jgi:hypothetical protein
MQIHDQELEYALASIADSGLSESSKDVVQNEYEFVHDTCSSVEKGGISESEAAYFGEQDENDGGAGEEDDHHVDPIDSTCVEVP